MKISEFVPDPDENKISLSLEPVSSVSFGAPPTLIISENLTRIEIWSPALYAPLFAKEDTSNTLGVNLSFRVTLLLFCDTSAAFPVRSKILLFTGVTVTTSAPFGVPFNAKPSI